MGGLVKTVIQTKDGNFLSAVIGTGYISTLVWHRSIRTKDVEGIKSLLKLLDCGLTDSSLTPYGYGIIYVNLAANKIVSCQSYTDIGKAYCLNLDREMKGFDTYPSSFPEDHTAVFLFKEMVNDGLVTGVGYKTCSGEQIVQYDEPLKMKTTLVELLTDAQEVSNYSSHILNGPIAFQLDLPFEVIVIRPDEENLIQIMTNLTDLEFTTNEKKIYADFYLDNFIPFL